MVDESKKDAECAIKLLLDAYDTVMSEARCSGDVVAKENLFSVAEDIKRAIRLLGFDT